MQFEIDFVHDPTHDVLVVLSGDLTVDGSRAWLTELVGDERWRPEMRALVDGTRLTVGAGFTGEEVRAMAKSTGQHDAWGAGSSAVVVDSPVVFGLLRMWQAALRGAVWRIEVFYTRDNALAWLSSPVDLRTTALPRAGAQTR